MKEYLIIPKQEWERKTSKIELEKNVTEQKNITDETKNLLIENINMKKRYKDKKLDHKNFDMKISKNSLPKNVRIEGENLLNDLINQNFISIENNGEIKNLKSTSQPKINGEDMLRNIFFRNASIKNTKFFFKNFVDFIPNQTICNK